MNQVFESDRIRFVQVSELLIGDYLLMVNDTEHVQRFFGGSHGPYTEEQEIHWVQGKLAEKAPVFSMLDKQSGQFIGNIELMGTDVSCRELGIAITAGKQDMGYGTEAVAALTDYGMNQLKLKRIFLRTNPANTRALHVYEKCGFREYLRTDSHVFMEFIP